MILITMKYKDGIYRSNNDNHDDDYNKTNDIMILVDIIIESQNNKD